MPDPVLNSASTSILWPLFAMVLLTCIVWARLYIERVGEMRERRIRPQAIATAKQAAETLQRVGAMDNLRNLLELPVLFYVLCILLLVTGKASALHCALAWLFVAGRIAHSWIHCTYNRVMHRLYAFAVSSFALWAMWLVFAWQIAVSA
jgi:hypothetical protein